MATLAELLVWKSALQKARYSGTRRVELGNSLVEYKSDAEMDRALAALDRDIAAASSSQPVRIIRISSSKGL